MLTGILTQFALLSIVESKTVYDDIFEHMENKIYFKILMTLFLECILCILTQFCLFKMRMGILTQFSFQNAHGYPDTVCFSECSWVSSHSFLLKMLMGILTQFAQNAQGYPYTAFF